MSTERPRIALVSGLAAAAPPAEAALQTLFPEADVWNILDDRLVSDTTASGGANSALEARFDRLLDHAAAGGAKGILITCSLYSHLAPRAAERLGITVLGPDDAAFQLVVEGGYSSVSIVSGVAEALTDSVQRAGEAFAAAGRDITVRGVFVPAARPTSLAGDFDATAQHIADALGAEDSADAVLLANYSLSPAAEKLSALLDDLPVVAGPVVSAEKLRDALR